MLGEELWVMYVGQRTGTRAQPQIRTKEKTNKKKINITKQDIRSFLGAHKDLSIFRVNNHCIPRKKPTYSEIRSIPR